MLFTKVSLNDIFVPRVPTAILEYAKKSSFIEFFRLESRLFMLSRAPISAILLSS